jgi:hypothetical protein
MKKQDPLKEWKKRSQSSNEVLAGYQGLLAILQTVAGEEFIAQTQKFPPKYVLDVAPQVRLQHGKRFASVAAVGDTIYFELCQWDDAFQKQMRRGLKGVSKPEYDGYPFTTITDRVRDQLASMVQTAHAKLLGQSQRDEKVKLYQPKSQVKVPPMECWTQPLSWTSKQARPSDNYSRHIPSDAVFTRGELLFTLYKNLGPGMKRETERTLPGVLRIERISKKGLPDQWLVVAAHVKGFDGQAWSVQLVRQGKRSFMPLYVGNTFVKQTPASAKLLKQYRFSRIEIQSILSAENGKAIIVSLRENFEVEEIDECEDEEE